MAGVMVTQGTQTNVKTTTIGTQEYQHVVLNIGTAADNPFKGTIPEVTNLVGGTLNNGTVSTVGVVHPNFFGTTVMSGTTDMGTIKAAAGAGTSIYVTDIIISVGSVASDVVIGNGGTALGSLLIGTLSFAANQGMVSNFRSPLKTVANAPLIYKQSAVSPLSISVQGYTA